MRRPLSVRGTNHSTGLVQNSLFGAWKGVEKSRDKEREGIEGQRETEGKRGRKGSERVKEGRESKEAYLAVAR